DEAVRKLSEFSRPPEGRQRKGFENTLIFRDGRQLCGQMVSMDKEEIVWRRPDASAALHFPRAEVRRIQFGKLPPKGAGESASEFTPASVHFANGDWVYGDLRSGDGEKFTLTTASRAEISFGRAQVARVFFDREPKPMAGFFGHEFDLEQ